MKPFITHTGLVAPLPVANIDTDQIIPKQFLKRIERTGFGQFLFYDWRFHEDGTPVEEFILNNKDYQGASILIAHNNFGCGSSREHAPWALLDYGFRAVIAPSFADIFYNNCFKNGMLPIVLKEEEINNLLSLSKEGPFEMTIDLEKQSLSVKGMLEYSFQTDPYRRKMLLEGLDDIGLTEKFNNEISAYEQKRELLFS
ncbi:3-isopropylmalate dehydratase small subunit [Bacillus pinisoli]|uniref:3-isopropylmalate dehydratase small subunit n=1 Tax=Bacillus pinisoli TaxID=2901866 RepID=UPI001FF46F31|nr:3-isopropylmalate dehydratase small subunit [Bacillus pinisoli]